MKATATSSRDGEPDRELAIILVNHDGGELAVRRFERNRAVADPHRRWQWIVVDNASRDGSARSFAAIEGIEMLRREQNDGFAAGVNTGARAAGAANLALLNPDIDLREQTLAQLLRTLAGDDRIAAVGPQLFFPEGRPQLSAYRFATPAARIFRLLGGKRLLGALGIGRRGRVQLEPGINDVEVVKGACMMIRRAAWDEVGPLDEEFFLYHEEMDWCRRARRLGWRCVIDTCACAAHDGIYLQDPLQSARFIHSSRGLRHYFEKHHSPLAATAVQLATRLSYSLRGLAARLAPGRSAEQRRALAATFAQAARAR